MATGAKAKAAASKEDAAAAAAQAEANDDKHEVEFQGLTLALPPKLRESVIWRFGILREGDFQGVARLLQSVIGDEQFSRVLDKLDEDEVHVDPDAEVSPMAKLLSDALETYGLSPGESEASSGS